MTAWMEVASQINDLARAIAKPDRREQAAAAVAATEAASHGHEAVGGRMNDFVMLPGFRASSKKDAIVKMVAEIARASRGRVKDEAAAVEAVMKREASMPTGLDRGIAVPHGRTSAVDGIAGAVATLAPDCSVPDYETIDNSQVRIIVLTLANDQSQTPYLQLMSFISRALRSGGGADALAACKTPEEMRRFFRKRK